MCYQHYGQFSIDIKDRPVLCFLHEKAMPYQSFFLSLCFLEGDGHEDRI